MADDAQIWEPLLEPGETLIWSGRPSDGWHFRKSQWPVVMIAAGCAGIAGLVFLSDVRTEAPGWFLAFMGFVGLLGLGLIPWVFYRDRAMRQRMHYGLTQGRALILTLGSKRLLRVYPVDETNRLDIVPYGGLASVLFKDEYLSIGLAKTQDAAEIGFEWITDAEEVAAHLRRLGAGTASAGVGITKGIEV